jgi:hypothetical protein
MNSVVGQGSLLDLAWDVRIYSLEIFWIMGIALASLLEVFSKTREFCLSLTVSHILI